MLLRLLVLSLDWSIIIQDKFGINASILYIYEERNMELEKLREEIRLADKELAQAFTRRMNAVKEIAEYKKSHGIAIEDTTQEQSVIENGAAAIEDETLRSFFVPFIKDAIKASKNWQRHLIKGQRVAYCGGMDPRDYTVAGNAFPGCTRVDYPNHAKTYEAVVNGECDVAVLPFEKSINGEIGQVLDMMFEGDLFINKVISVESDSDTLRYAVLSRVANDSVTPGADNRFMVMFTVKDEPGALAGAINTLSSHGHNMSIMRSRHMKDLPWNYYFYAEASGDVDVKDVAALMEEMKVSCQLVKPLGCYEAV